MSPRMPPGRRVLAHEEELQSTWTMVEVYLFEVAKCGHLVVVLGISALKSDEPRLQQRLLCWSIMARFALWSSVPMSLASVLPMLSITPNQQ